MATGSQRAPAPPESEISKRRERRRSSAGSRSDARWQEILSGAARAFTRLGYGQATLEDVAHEVGINRATLYYYVGTKEELLVALLLGPIDEMRQQIEQIAVGPGTAPDRLRGALRAYAESMVQTPELFIFLSENVHKVMSGSNAEQIRGNADSYGRTMTTLIRQGVEAGDFRSDIEPLVAVLGILGMFNWIHRWYDPDGPQPLTYFTETFIEMALSGLNREAARASAS
ncbi:TetR/AcrR family transcriptional regulator [Cryptosporangium sp. NPDC048952]|uniref:TetR/AcrR family transcriptional regulator n=1 Tax=Cryptosporangium sp. NPDC048952 TaxID=3363961 RepID=UPI003717B57E